MKIERFLQLIVNKEPIYFVLSDSFRRPRLVKESYYSLRSDGDICVTDDGGIIYLDIKNVFETANEAIESWKRSEIEQIEVLTKKLAKTND